ncbi:MAG TPA: hypothetical protein VE170_00710 [Candidatus Limnocylindria bacterium]|nr:hypothetical protein [Candidatus Limnocylindria bacterium]
MMDTLVQKAWELYQHTALFPVETILTATVWLEQKYRKTPGEKIALAIALHYLILALRHDAGMGSATAEEYCARAARWQARACESNAVAPTAKGTEEN